MRTPSPVDIHREVANHFRARVITPTAPWSVKDLPSSHHARVKVGARRFDVIATEHNLSIQASGFETGAWFGVNRSIYATGHRKLPQALGSRKHPVYVLPVVEQEPVWERPTVVRCIENLQLRRHEWLHLAANGLVSSFRPHSLQRVLEILSNLNTLIDELPQYREPTETFSDLPEQFADLIPMLRVWAIGDDSERVSKLSKASTESLTRLIKKVKPRLDDIGRCLNAFPEDPPESVVPLGTLAECVCEAIVFLEARQRRPRRT